MNSRFIKKIIWPVLYDKHLQIVLFICCFSLKKTNTPRSVDSKLRSDDFRLLLLFSREALIYLGPVMHTIRKLRVARYISVYVLLD